MQFKQQFSPVGGAAIAVHGPAVVQYVRPSLHWHGYCGSTGDLIRVSVSQSKRLRGYEQRKEGLRV